MSKPSILLTSEVCRSDKFLDLSFEAQALYLQACFECDSYGLFSNPKTLLRTTGNINSALDELIESGFLIPIEHEQSLCFVVRNWWQMNKLDRTKFNNPPLVEVMNLCTISGSNEFHLISEALEMGFIEAEKGKSEGLPNIKMYGTPELVPDQSPSSPEGETNSNVTNSNSNEHNELQRNCNTTNFTKHNSKYKEKENSPQLVPDQYLSTLRNSETGSQTVKCPKCGNLTTVETTESGIPYVRCANCEEIFGLRNSDHQREVCK